MTTIEERREIAAKLRSRSDDEEFHSENPMARGVHLLIAICESVFHDRRAREMASEQDMLNRLADLIEPSGHECVPGECSLNVRHDSDFIDRDALLALADDMQWSVDHHDGIRSIMRDFKRGKLSEDKIVEMLVLGWEKDAKTIREAVGA